jgi:hypothetical protein
MTESIAEAISRRKRENPTPEEIAAAAAYVKQLQEDVAENQKIHFSSGPSVIDGKALERHRRLTGQ